MAISGKLTAKFAETAPIGRHNDGLGLWLTVRENGSRAWHVRYTCRGRRRDLGAGPLQTTSLSEARQKAIEVRRMLRDGLDPIAERRKEQSIPTFKVCADRYIEAHAPSWANLKHRQQWEQTIKIYVNPVIGFLLVDQIELKDVVRVLKPIWETKTDTATRIRGRIERILGWAKTQGFRSGENPARWKNHLDNILAKPSKVTKVQHMRALPWAEVPQFMRDLRKHSGSSARALEFAVLTAARSGEVRGATWDEIDLDAQLWTVPADRMKMGVEHRVPLSSKAIALLEALPRFDGTELVFPSPRKGVELSDMALNSLTRKMKIDAVPHGFRSSFRDWAAESTSYPREVCELALSHTVGSKVEQAYQRGDLFEKRKKLMEAWADFCDKVQASTADVTPIRAAR